MSMNSLPKYSVLMAVYINDQVPYFTQALKSILNQTNGPSDIVLVCDGRLSNDLNSCVESFELELGNQLKVVRLKDNHGLAYALNAGMPFCSQDIVARMDSDDIARPDRCELLLKKLMADNLDLVGGAIEEFEAEPGDMGVFRIPPTSQNDIKSFAKKRNPFNHMTVMFKKERVSSVGGYQEFAWLEDYWLWVRMIQAGCRCGNIPEVVVDVRAGSGMYARRSNYPYLKSQIHFFKTLYNQKFINLIELCTNIVERSVVALMPEKTVKSIYNRLLRDR